MFLIARWVFWWTQRGRQALISPLSRHSSRGEAHQPTNRANRTKPIRNDNESCPIFKHTQVRSWPRTRCRTLPMAGGQCAILSVLGAHARSFARMLDDEFKDINIYGLGGSVMMVDVDRRRKQASSLSLSFCRAVCVCLCTAAIIFREAYCTPSFMLPLPCCGMCLLAYT